MNNYVKTVQEERGNCRYGRNRGKRAEWRILQMNRRREIRTYRCARWLKWLCGWEGPSRARWWLCLSRGSITSSSLGINTNWEIGEYKDVGIPRVFLFLVESSVAILHFLSSFCPVVLMAPAQMRHFKGQRIRWCKLKFLVESDFLLHTNSLTIMNRQEDVVIHKGWYTKKTGSWLKWQIRNRLPWIRWIPFLTIFPSQHWTARTQFTAKSLNFIFPLFLPHYVSFKMSARGIAT